ncbi:MAG: hypothetical protein CL908_01585 [Deltaproteobacteria bacterium]|nr:hypothetical protein [Deltaproteobacteria bacterium]
MSAEGNRSNEGAGKKASRPRRRRWPMAAIGALLTIGVTAPFALAKEAPPVEDQQEPVVYNPPSDGKLKQAPPAGARTRDGDRPDAAVDAEDPGWKPVAYIPPSRGRARNTAGAGTRTFSAGTVTVEVLAPKDHIALTTRAQPTLYWYVSQDTSTRIDLTLVDEDSIDPLLELTVPGPVSGGIHALRLDEEGLELSLDKTYRWHVALVRDAQRRANDTFAEGFIARTPVSTDLARSLDEANDRFAPYALSGIWYDAMHELVEAIEQNPHDERLVMQRSALLDQADLEEVAVYAVREGR